MIRSFLLLCLAMFLAGVGNIFFGKGMRPRPGESKTFWSTAINPYIWLGIVASTGYFFLWLVVLSWADVSWALPMNAVEYVMVALLAMIFLKERIEKTRWIGIGLICAGIFFMMRSW